MALLSHCARLGYEWLDPLEGYPAPVGGSGAPGGVAGAGGVPGLVPHGVAGDAGAAGGSALPDAATVPLDASGPWLPDASGDLPPCAALGPFGEPELVLGLGDGPFFSPTLDRDGLELLFASDAPGDLFRARRASRGTITFSGVTPLGVNTASAEVTPRSATTA